MTESTDTTLVEQAQAGQKAAFSQLVERHWPRVRRVLLAAGVEPGEVEDLLQEAFLQAYLSLETLRDPTRFRAWVCGIGLNLARMGWRKRPFPTIPWDHLEGTAVADPAPSPEQQAARRLRLERLNAALADLPPSERDALLLVYRDGLTHRETAVLLGATPGAVKVRVHRGRRRLRTQLQAERPAPPADVAAREDYMIAVEIVDVVARVIDEQELGIDKTQVLADALAKVPAERRAAFLEHTSLGVTLSVNFWEKTIMALDEGLRPQVMRALGNVLPHRVVLLRETGGARVLPIWIGPCEADAIAIKLANRQLARPIGTDLTQTLLNLNGTRLEKAAVSRLHEGIFYGTLFVRLPGQDTPAEVDCRPSDALTLAVRMDTPVFVAAEVMDAQSVPAAHFTRQVDGTYRIKHAPMQPGQWRSLLR